MWGPNSLPPPYISAVLYWVSVNPWLSEALSSVEGTFGERRIDTGSKRKANRTHQTVQLVVGGEKGFFGLGLLDIKRQNTSYHKTA